MGSHIYCGVACCLTLLFMCPLSVLANSANDEALYLHNIKREIPAEEKSVQTVLREQAESLSANSFDLDPVLIQEFDQDHNHMKYSILGTQKPLYVRSGDNRNQDLIILSSSEDGIKYIHEKRIYILLKEIKGQANNSYHPFVAFIRNATKNDDNRITVAGAERVIEWDQWDEHYSPFSRDSRESILSMNTLICVSSFILPCGVNEEIIKRKDLVKSPRFASKVPTEKDIDIVEASKYVTKEGYTTEENYDFYSDLDEHKLSNQKGRFIGNLLNSIFGGGGGNGGSGGFLGGLLGGILGNGGDGGGGGQGLLGGILGAAAGLISGVAGSAEGVVCSVLSIIGGSPCEGGGEQQQSTKESITTIIQHLNVPMPMQMGYSSVGYQPGPPGMIVGRRRREVTATNDVSIFDFPGWKTQFVDIKPGVYLKDSKTIFYGFGNCPSHSVTKDDLDKANSNEEVIEFYLTLMRTECISWMKPAILKLIDEKIIEVSSNKTLTFINKHLGATPKLNLKEELQLSIAGEMCTITNQYIKDINNPVLNPKSPDGKDISTSIDFLVRCALKSMDVIRQYVRHHIIHYTRRMLSTLKIALSKVIQDQENLKLCADCANESDLSYNDKMVIMGLIQFVKHGVGPVDNGQDATKEFQTFYQNEKNLEAIQIRVNLYS